MEACGDELKHKTDLKKVDLEELGRERDMPESKFESNLKLNFFTLRDESVDVEAVKAILKARLQQRAEEWINGQTADVLVPQIIQRGTPKKNKILSDKKSHGLREIEIDEMRIEILPLEGKEKYLGQAITFEDQDSVEIQHRFRSAWAACAHHRRELPK